MSQLDPVRTQLNEALGQVNETMDAYQSARAMLQRVQGGEAIDLSTVGRTLTIGNLQIPLPADPDPQRLQYDLASAANFLAVQVQEAWHAVYDAAERGCNICDAAAQRAQQAGPPPQSQPQTVAPQPIPPQPQAVAPAQETGLQMPPPAQSRPTTLQPAIAGQVTHPQVRPIQVAGLPG